MDDALSEYNFLSPSSIALVSLDSLYDEEEESVLTALLVTEDM